MEYKDTFETWVDRASNAKDHFRLEVGNNRASKCVLIVKGTKRRSDWWFACTAETLCEHPYSNIKFRGTRATPVPSYVPKYAQKTGKVLKKSAKALDIVNKGFLYMNIASCLKRDFTDRSVSNTLTLCGEEVASNVSSAIGSNIGAVIGGSLGGPVGSTIGRIVGGMAATWVAPKCVSFFKSWF